MNGSSPCPWVPGMTTQAELRSCQSQLGPKSSLEARCLAGSDKASGGWVGGAQQRMSWAKRPGPCTGASVSRGPMGRQTEGRACSPQPIPAGQVLQTALDHLSAALPGTFVCGRCRAGSLASGAAQLWSPGGIEGDAGGPEASPSDALETPLPRGRSPPSPWATVSSAGTERSWATGMMFVS